MRLLHRHSKGQVLVLLALTMIMLLAVVALAVDIGRAYGVKAKLNAAVDAASFEAANSLAQGSGEEGMRKRAAQVAREFFAANYRLKFMGADPPVPTVTSVRDASTGAWTVRVAATAQMPTFFAGMLGWRTLDVSAASETVRGTLDMVLDTSESMRLNNQFPEVQKRAKDFVSLFDKLDDRIGVVAFASGAKPIVSLCGTRDPQDPHPNSMDCGRGFDPNIVNSAIGDLTSEGMTASQEGLKKALDQLRGLKQNQASGHRAIVFFSDGAPNTFSGKFSLQGGGNVEGNLYSGVYPVDGADGTFYVYDQRYLHVNLHQLGERYNVNGLPQTDLSGSISAESDQKTRSLTHFPTHPHLKCDANAIARNMAENVALMARKEGITVYSIGLGVQMTTSQMFDEACSTKKEVGTTILRRMANTPDSDTYDSTQPTGIFCLALDAPGLKQCFDRVASTILRITK